MPCKILEKIIVSHLTEYLNQHNLLSEHQFGFRKGKNTELAAMRVVDRIMPAVRDKKFSICVFLDFSKCFDTIDREILFEKLSRYGVRGVSLELLVAYYDNRVQYVNINNFNSRALEQNLGVIQGSKTGPTFSDIYSNDLSNNKIFDIK